MNGVCVRHGRKDDLHLAVSLPLSRLELANFHVVSKRPPHLLPAAIKRQTEGVPSAIGLELPLPRDYQLLLAIQLGYLLAIHCVHTGAVEDKVGFYYVHRNDNLAQPK